jgi:hypothetical protein
VNLVLDLGHATPVGVSVYDLAGRLVARPIQNEWLEGPVTRTWQPGALPRGVYFMKTALGGREEVRRLVWLGQDR